MKKRKLRIRYLVLAVLLLCVVVAQLIPAVGAWYAYHLYPSVSAVLITFSTHIPFSLGDVFITCSVIGLIAVPLYGHYKNRLKWKILLLRDGEYLLWVYVWFYLAWGLNYSRPHFYARMGIVPGSYSSVAFNSFLNTYIDSLNAAYVRPDTIVDKQQVRSEVIRIYRQIGDSLKIHAPLNDHLQVKTMLFSDFISSVGVTGYMGPFFGEFNLNGNLLPISYPATYAHEMAHLLGISSEAEANFYAYQVCTRSHVPSIRFSGYFFVVNYVLANAKLLMNKEQFKQLVKRIRPEVRYQMSYYHYYWEALYSPVLGSMQSWLYDLYLKGNKIESGRKNYFQVVGLLVNYEQFKNKR